MNERIRELAEQAGFQINPLKGLIHLPGLNPTANIQLEKFAELIVGECARVVNDTEYPYENQSYKNVWDTCCVWSAEKLKEHFGVKE
jgi:hypothetical protein